MTSLVQVIGGGKMGEALVVGLRAAADAPTIRVVEPDPSRAEQLRSTHPGLDVGSESGAAAATIIAVKPHHVAAVLPTLTDPGRVLSVAAGVTIATLEAGLPAGTPVIRAMPNTPALVGQGASAIAGGSNASAADVAWARATLEAVGIVVEVAESSLDAVTGLSGSGPAYVFLVLEAMIEGGVAAGLPRDIATALATQTVVGAGALAAVGDLSAAELRAAVTSPGGTTAAGLRTLESAAVRAAVIDAIAAATERSCQLGQF